MRTSNHRDLMGFSKFLELLKAQPNRSLKHYASILGCDTRQVQKWTREIEVVYVVGQDPSSGRSGVKLWSIQLPDHKRQAVKASC